MAESEKPTILVAFEHKGDRERVAGSLGREPHQSVFVCPELRNGREALDKARELRPEIVFLDGDISGALDATRGILSSLPKAKVVLFAERYLDQIVRDAVGAGVHGFHFKTEFRAAAAAAKALRMNKSSFTSFSRSIGTRWVLQI